MHQSIRYELDVTIGQQLPAVYTRRILCRYKEVEQAEYRRISAIPLRKLVWVTAMGRICWNRKFSRKLILFSTWLSWALIEEHFMANDIKVWRRHPDIAYQMLCLLREKEIAKGASYRSRS
jgi:hypothetical protein